MSLLELGYATSYALEHMTSHAANQPRAVALVQQLAWDDLRIFLALAQSHSTRQAALRIGVNASTISRKLAALEETLGARLVERHPDGLKLTKAGADVVDAALQMNEQVRSLAQRVAGADRRLVGIVRVCAPEILAPSIARALVPMLAEHGELQVDLRVDDQLVDLSRHETDLAVRVSDTPPPDCIGRKLGRANVGIYASEDYWAKHPFALTDERHRWIEWPSYVKRKAAYAWLEREVPAHRVVVHASSSQAVAASVAGGLGLALLTHVHARQYTTLVSRWALPDACGTDVWALTHRETSRNARVRAVLAALRNLSV